MSLSLAKVLRLLLTRGGIEKNPGPTNGETLEWLKSLSSEKYSESNLEAAKTFLNGFVGGRKMFGSWREKFLSEHKRERHEAHRRLMKSCGGSGKDANIPPKEYIPYSLVVNVGKCGKCSEQFKSESDVKMHIQDEHKADVKKMFAKEALEMVTSDDKYVEWLKKSPLSTEMNEIVQMQQLKDANEILTERVNSQNRNAYVEIKEFDGISEMQRQVLKTNEDGTITTSVVTKQFLDVTTRKRKSTDGNNIDSQQKKNINTLKNQSKKVENVIKHVAGESIENQAGLVAKYVDKKGLEFAAAVNKQSKQLKENHKFTPAQTAAIISSTNMPDSTMDKMRTVHNKNLGSSPYASRHQVEKVRKEVLVVNREDWEANEHDLYIHKQGNNVNQKKKTCVLSVKNLKTYIQKMAEAEKDNLRNLKDMDEIIVCYDGDGGGGRFVCEFAFLNNIDRKIKIHPMLIYEGTDTRVNLEVTLGKLTEQIKKLEGEIILVDGRQLKIHQYGVFDLSALNTILGKQGHSATFFDAWTDVRLSHIRNHNGETHTPDICTEINFLSLEDLDKYYTHHSVESLSTSTAAQFGSVVANNLLPLRDIYHYIPPAIRGGQNPQH